MSSSKETLLFSYRDSVATITLNREKVLNAIDLEMGEALKARLGEVAGDPAVRAVVLTGSGRAFCSGGDLHLAMTANPEQPGDSFLALTGILHPCIQQIREMPKPVIAAINGPAAGAGLSLALACDLRLIAESAYLKQSNTSHGLTIPAGGTFTLPRMVGLARALEIALLDEPIPAAQAFELGLVSKVVPEETLLNEAWDLAYRVAQMPVATLGRVKQLMNQAFYVSLEEQLQTEQQAIAVSANSAEGREGISAFLEKREPYFIYS